MKSVMYDKTDTVLVVGGGPAGLSAALIMGETGLPVVLVERDRILGGMLNRLFRRYPKGDNPRDLLNSLHHLLEVNPQITVLTETTVSAVTTQRGNFQVMTQNSGDRITREIEAGAVILATGLTLMDVSIYGEYGYGIYPGVITSLEFEERLQEESLKTDRNPSAVAFISCVGSRDRSRGNPYCSKICCMYTAKQAGLVRDLLPDARIYVFYIDCRICGKGYEEFVRDVIERKHVRYVRGRPAKVLPENGRLIVRAEDTLMGIPVEVAVDLVILAPAVVPHPETQELAQSFNVGTDVYGFLDHDQFPSAPRRVFTAGGCRYAVGIDEAIEQGMAAGGRAIALIRGKVRP
ncbi:MAG: FAD-dependent oxidoreductase [Deltaproteobacteria bacterium]|nr:FAD-dependent oxidoreductase [Deltaproteobacteria bacterium]